MPIDTGEVDYVPRVGVCVYTFLVRVLYVLTQRMRLNTPRYRLISADFVLRNMTESCYEECMMLVLVRTRVSLTREEWQRYADVKYVGRGFIVLEVPLPERVIRECVNRELRRIATDIRRSGKGKWGVFRREFVVLR